MVKKDLLNLLNKNNYPLAVPEILTKINANKTTIYRALDSCVEDELVNEIELGDGKKRYESTKLPHHHHLVCLTCKKIEEIKIGDSFEKEEKNLEKKTGYRKIHHNLEFFGFCATCK